MKRLIDGRWFSVIAATAATVLVGTSLSLSFGQSPLPGTAPPSQRAGSTPDPFRDAARGYKTTLGGNIRSPDSTPEANFRDAAREYKTTLGGNIRSADSSATLDAEIRAVIEAYRQHDGQEEKARIAEALPDLVAKQFDARQLLREGELNQLEEQLRKLRELHQRRAKQRDQIVQDRVRQLLRDADGIGWGSDEESSVRAGSDPFRAP